MKLVQKLQSIIADVDLAKQDVLELSQSLSSATPAENDGDTTLVSLEDTFTYLEEALTRLGYAEDAAEREFPGWEEP